MESRFFPYNPRSTRLGLFLGACVLVILTAWAVADAREDDSPLALARAGVTAGLLLLFVFAWHRLRPRPGWGVTLGARGVELARPFTGTHLRLSWGTIASVRRLGRREDTLGLFLEEGGRVLLTRHLFPSRHCFAELAASLEERKPPPGYDA
jgi:hypothetical protein